MLYTRVPLRVCGIGSFQMFEAYEEGEGKKEKTERRREEGAEWKNTPKYISMIGIPSACSCNVTYHIMSYALARACRAIHINTRYYLPSGTGLAA